MRYCFVVCALLYFGLLIHLGSFGRLSTSTSYYTGWHRHEVDDADVRSQLEDHYFSKNSSELSREQHALHELVGYCSGGGSKGVAKQQGMDHVAVVIRFFSKNVLAAGSLMINLVSTAQCSEHPYRLSFYLVATDSSVATRKAGFALAKLFDYLDIEVVAVPLSLFEDIPSPCPLFSITPVAQAADIICTAPDKACIEWVHTISHSMVEALFTKTCYPNQQHYIATDMGLKEALECQTCSHVLVTNADNHYTDSFLANTLTNSVDISIVSFYQNGSPPSIIEAIPMRKRIDLGGVVVRANFLRKHNISFGNSLPPNAQPRDHHDNDWWLVDHVLKRNATVATIKSVDFLHL